MSEVRIMTDCEVQTNNPNILYSSLGIPNNVSLYTALNQLFGHLMPIIPENEEKINVLLQVLMINRPKSVLEAQLMVQLLMCHRLSTKMLSKTAKEPFPEIAEKYLNMAVKLSRVFTKGMETLSKVRRDGKQHIYIEHVTVEKDAQAIIGNVNKGG